MNDSLSNDTITCVVCFKNVLYYSIGECDHPVCFECSTRMRVLCLQNECPICRQDLSRVVFTESVLTYKELRNQVFPDRMFERSFKIGFSTEAIKNAYDKLLEHCCRECHKLPPFRTFSMLSDHMRKVHEKFFCDLCVKHLKIFTHERKCYTRQELAHHRRKGDLDDTSHRGHPLCEFCEERFMDADELYRHLRKEHLYCHLCDADGKNLYYATHSALAHHFRTEHFLCEEGDCAGNHLTAVFRTEIDLKAHKATVHGRGMTRTAARQARTLELSFNITPHPVVRERGQRDRDRERQEPPPEPLPPPPPTMQNIDTRSDAQFPRLSAVPTAPHLVLAPSKAYRGVEGLTRNDKNFPTLGGAPPNAGPSRPSTTQPAAAILRNSKPSVSIQLHSQPTTASNFRLTQTSGNRVSIPQKQLSDDDFPSLGLSKDDHPSIGAGTVQPSKVTVINSQEMQSMKSSQGNQGNQQPKKQQINSESFPALTSTSVPADPPQWISVSKGKNKNKPAKVESPPQPKAFNPAADFPTLPANSFSGFPVSKKPTKKPTLVQMKHQSQPTVHTNQDAKNKKEKKKQNIPKKDDQDYTYVNGITDKLTKQQIREAYNVAVNENNNQTVEDKKIKTIEQTSTVNEKKSNGGNGDFALMSKDFPNLNPNSPSVPAPIPNYAPSKNKKVPNGNIPPGFKPRPACDGMTFTNSSGQTFPAPVHTYIPPPDFEQRNRALVMKFTAALGGTEALENFKVASRAFRDSIIDADEFYQHCKKAMSSNFDSLFPDLVALLPDIAKQQELVVGRNIEAKLEVCPTCGQLIAPTDRIAHDTAHWPPLAPH